MACVVAPMRSIKSAACWPNFVRPSASCVGSLGTIDTCDMLPPNLNAEARRILVGSQQEAIFLYSGGMGARPPLLRGSSGAWY